MYDEFILDAGNPRLKNFPEISQAIERINLLACGDFIYIVKENQNNNVVFWSIISSIEKINIVHEFNTLFNRINIKSEDNIKLLISFYQRVNSEDLVSIINNPYSIQDDYLNEFLKESNGYLIYRHQFENLLIDRFGFSNQDAINMRKDWNLKRYAKIEELKINPNFIPIIKRMPFYFVISKHD